METGTASENNLYKTDREVDKNENKITYGIVKEIYSLNGFERVAYGIVGYANSEEDGTATIILSVNDITSDHKSLSDLVEKLNRNNVSPMHILDIIEDFIF